LITERKATVGSKKKSKNCPNDSRKTFTRRLWHFSGWEVGGGVKKTHKRGGLRGRDGVFGAARSNPGLGNQKTLPLVKGEL